MGAVAGMFSEAARHAWAKGGLATYINGDADQVVAEICSAVRQAEATAVNVRIWMPGLPRRDALRQIELFGATVYPSLQERLSSTSHAGKRS
jgi:hypothetical protein